MTSTEAQAASELKARLSDREWRLNNLYYVIDKGGRRVKFKMNWAQKQLLDNLWYLNIVLKARQLGMSTFVCILFLDICLFNSNRAAGHIADTLSNAKAFMRDKIKYAYDNLPEAIQQSVPISRFSLSADDAGIWFANGSSIRVGTSFRSGTLQYLHISEYAKICRKAPDKAREIRNGALNTVDAGNMIFVESTAEGTDGHFYDMTKLAEENSLQKKELSHLDYKFHFFPWWKQDEYSLDFPAGTVFSGEAQKYFVKLEHLGIQLNDGQKYWYVKKKETLSEDIKQEYPSYPEEAFEFSSEGRYFYDQILQARKEQRVCEFGIDQHLPVHTWWDLGMDDYMSIWFVQLFGKEVRLVDYMEGSGEGLSFYISALWDKGYTYGDHYAPHDIRVRELSAKGQSRQEYAKTLGINFKIVPNLGFDDGIDAARRILKDCYFRESSTSEGLKHLSKYSKKWNETLGMYTGERHDEHSHAASAFRYMAVSRKTEERQEESGHDVWDSLGVV